MQLFPLNFPLGQLPTQAPQLPDLPAGPSLDRVRGPIEIPAFEPWQINGMIALGIITLGLVIWGIVRALNAQKNRTHTIPAHRAAIAELNAAAELTSKDDERFAVLSSLALRRYFETGKGIPSLGRTTLEFLQALERHPQLTDEARMSLRAFLDHCDRVKFAQATLSESERSALTHSAIDLIQLLEQPAEPMPTPTVPS